MNSYPAPRIQRAAFEKLSDDEKWNLITLLQSRCQAYEYALEATGGQRTVDVEMKTPVINVSVDGETLRREILGVMNDVIKA